MTQEEKEKILLQAKNFFKNKIVRNHEKKVIALGKLSEFNPNPFLEKYLANFAFGNCSSENIAN